MWGMSQICWKWLKSVARYLKNGKLLICVDNDLSMYEMTDIRGKWLKYVGYGLDMWKMT